MALTNPSSSTPEVPSQSQPADLGVTIRIAGGSGNKAEQIAQNLFNESIGIVFYGSDPVEQLLARMAKTTPALNQSKRFDAGPFLRTGNSETFWVAFDGPQGSALAVWPDAGYGDWAINQFMVPTDALPAPPWREIVEKGKCSPTLARILDAAAVAPVWEVPEFRFLDDGNGFPVLPASVRRAAQSWSSTDSCDLFTKNFHDSDGDIATIFLSIDSSMISIGGSNVPSLLYNLGSFAADATFVEFLLSRGPYTVAHEELSQPVALMLRTIPLGIDAAGLDQLAQAMVDDLAEYIHQTSHDSAPGPMLPPSIVRAAQSWKPVENGTFYSKDFPTSDHRQIRVNLCVDSDPEMGFGDSNVPILVVNCGAMPADLFTVLIEPGTYTVAHQTGDPQTLYLLHTVPLDIDEAGLDKLAQTMVDDAADFASRIIIRGPF